MANADHEQLHGERGFAKAASQGPLGLGAISHPPSSSSCAHGSEHWLLHFLHVTEPRGS